MLAGRELSRIDDAFRLSTRMHALLHAGGLDLAEQGRCTPLGRVSGHERERISAFVCLFHKAHNPPAYA